MYYFSAELVDLIVLLIKAELIIYSNNLSFGISESNNMLFL